MAQMLDFVVNLSLLTSGNFNSGISPAVKGLEDLQRKTQALQKTSANVSSLQKLEGQMQTNTAAMNTARLEAQQMGQRVQELQAKSASLSEQHGQASAKVQELSARLQANTAEYVKAAEQMQALTAAGQQNTAEFQQAQLTANKLAMQEKQLSRELKTASQQEKNFAREIKAADKEANRLTAEQQKLTQEADKLQSGLDRDRESLVNMRSALTEAGVNTDNLSSAQERLQQQLSDSAAAQDKLSQAQAKYEGYKQSLNWGNMKNDIMTSAGAVMAFQKPVQVMMDFEQAMANVRAVNGADDTQFKMLRDQALELGRTTQFSASQAANTQEALARGGFDPKQIVDAMPSVLAMAAAEGMELSQAGDIIVKTLGGMGYKDAQGNVDASQSGRVADVLANMSASSATNIAELGEGMKIAAPVMSQLGVSIEQLGAYLGGMANKGFVGSEAGNALASSAMRLSKLPKDTYNALADLKVSTRTKEGKMREFPDIMKAINEAFNKRKMGEAERMDYLARIFGTGQGKAMLGFMDAAVSGQIDALEVSNRENAQGKSQAMADVRNNTLVGDLAGLSSAWEGFMISVGKPLEDWTRTIVQGITQAISWVTQFMKEHEKLADIIVKVAAGIAALKVGFTVYNISRNVAGLAGSFLQVKSAMSGVNAAMQGASGAGGIFSSLGGVVSKVWGVIMAHPFVTIGAAVAAAGVLIYQNWDTIKEYAGKAWGAVKEYAASAASWCSEKWQAVSDWWQSWSLADVFSPVKDIAASVGSAFSGIIPDISWPDISLGDIFAPLKGYADSAVNWIQGKIQGFRDWWQSWSISDIFAPLGGFASSVSASVSAKWQSVMQRFSSLTLPNIFAPLSGFADSAVSWISGKWNALVSWFSSLSLPNIFAGLGNFAGNIASSIMGKFQAVSDWFSSLTWPNIFAPVSDMAANAWNSISAGWNSLVSGFMNWSMPDIFGSLTAYWDKAAGYIKNGWENVKGWFSSWFSSTPSPTPEAKQGSNNRGNAPTTGYHGVRRHAFGGILTTPHIGMVAEAGPEAIIPLSDKSRGQEVLLQAAAALGLKPETAEISLNSADTAKQSISELAHDVKESNINAGLFDNSVRGYDTGSNNTADFGQPQINITVNASGNGDNVSLAETIRQKVIEAWEELQERSERLAFA